ncbi:MAG TPA: fatty acid desaturase family protein [Labilithrix sp.]|nr:fatty acid desaturase family protein [Labilithrix sp.]
MGEPTKQHEASTLEAGYTAQHRTYEICGIILALTTSGWLIVRIAQCPPLSGWWMPLAALVGILLSDFISGFVHWMFDSWGGIDTPVVGRLAIRTFRHHHVDQKAITRHDFIETNGHNIALTNIYSVIGLLVLRSTEDVTLTDVFICMMLVCATVFTAFTSQIHKWAHQDEPSPLVAFLQRSRLILSPEHHARHHAAPYNRNYCITVGWMNGPLRAIYFFETLERTITALTGVVPREDDLGKETALEVATEAGSLDGADDEKALATRD